VPEIILLQPLRKTSASRWFLIGFDPRLKSAITLVLDAVDAQHA